MTHSQKITDHRPVVRCVLLMTLVLNLFVMALKAAVGYWTGSLSLVADALHSVTDSANNVLGLVTSHLSSPEPDRDHPYGHQKYEALGALGIAAFLGIACFTIFEGADVGTAHQITEAVESKLEEKYSPVRVNIHVEPPEYFSEEVSYDSSGT
jgi:divalent metal cation (Fe/Co/Zn/Cd) transporter